MGLFLGACCWVKFYVSKWVGLDNKNSLKHYENSLKQLVTLTVHGLIFGRAYNRKNIYARDLGGLFSEGLIFLRGGGKYYRNLTVYLRHVLIQGL